MKSLDYPGIGKKVPEIWWIWEDSRIQIGFSLGEVTNLPKCFYFEVHARFVSVVQIWPQDMVFKMKLNHYCSSFQFVVCFPCVYNEHGKVARKCICKSITSAEIKTRQHASTNLTSKILPIWWNLPMDNFQQLNHPAKMWPTNKSSLHCGMYKLVILPSMHYAHLCIKNHHITIRVDTCYCWWKKACTTWDVYVYKTLWIMG